MTNEQAAAYHEAAHAVIGRVLGLVCGEATIDYSEGGEGIGHSHVEQRWAFREGEYGAPKQLAEAFAVALYAGAEAERAFGIADPVADPVGDDIDQERAARALASYAGDHGARLRRKAKVLVQQHRARIERIAKALLERGTLEADEIDALLA